MHSRFAKRELNQPLLHCQLFAGEQLGPINDNSIPVRLTFAFDPYRSGNAAIDLIRTLFRGTKPTQCANEQ